MSMSLSVTFTGLTPLGDGKRTLIHESLDPCHGNKHAIVILARFRIIIELACQEHVLVSQSHMGERVCHARWIDAVRRWDLPKGAICRLMCADVGGIGFASFQESCQPHM